LLSNSLADYLFAYTAPVIVGDEAAPGPFGGRRVDDLKEATRVRKSIVERLGEDWLVRGWLKP
jgi:riboflavin biosynthesis pyrimidine reductase